MPTKSKAILKKALFTILAVVFWLCVWEVASIILARPLILPHVPEVLRELGRMISEGGFALTVTLSLSRVLLGFILGTLAGALIGTLTAFIPPFDTLLSPIISVVRANPVASFIMVIWSLISSSAVPTAIALLMVMPVVAQSTAASFRAIDRQLTEVAEVFDFSLGKKIRLLCDGSELKMQDNWIVNNYPDITFVDVSATPCLPDTVDTVVEVTYQE